MVLEMLVLKEKYPIKILFVAISQEVLALQMLEKFFDILLFND